MLEPTQDAGWVGNRGRAQTRLMLHRTDLLVAGTPRAHPCRSGVPRNTLPGIPTRWRRHAREICCHKSHSEDNQPPAHSPSAGTRPRAATASPTSGRRSIRDRPQDYVTAARRPTGTHRSAAWLRTPSTQSTSAGHIPPLPADITSPSPAPPTPH